MLRKTKPRAANRRISNTRQRRRQHLMEVSVRRETARRQKSQKIFGLLFKLILCVLLISGLYYGIREGLSRFFFDNPEYNLAEIEVTVVGDMSRAQVLEIANVKEGVNLFTLDLREISGRLEHLSQVEEVEVERVLPDKLSIHVTERRPVAWLAPIGERVDPYTDPRSVMLDARGFALSPQKGRSDYVNLPVIWCLPENQPQAGGAVTYDSINAALALLQKLQVSPLSSRFIVQEIDLSKEFCLVVKDKSKIAVMFAFENPEEQIAKLGLLLAHFDETHAQPATINLVAQRNTPVTFVENTVPALPAEPVLLEDERPSGAPARQSKPSSSATRPKRETPVPRAIPVRPNNQTRSSRG